MDHISLEGHNATYDDFSILISLNYTDESHFWLKKMNRNSIETFTPIPYRAFCIIISVIVTSIFGLL